MARITVHLDVPTDARSAFDHVADFTTRSGWDDSVGWVKRLDNGPIGLGSCFQVGRWLGPRTVPLEYVITTYEPPNETEPGRVVLSTMGRLHQGEDDVRFHPAPHGTQVRWNARLTPRGLGQLLDPLLEAGFRRTASRAVAGLERSLVTLAEQTR